MKKARSTPARPSTLTERRMIDLWNYGKELLLSSLGKKKQTKGDEI